MLLSCVRIPYLTRRFFCDSSVFEDLLKYCSVFVKDHIYGEGFMYICSDLRTKAKMNLFFLYQLCVYKKQRCFFIWKSPDVRNLQRRYINDPDNTKYEESSILWVYGYRFIIQVFVDSINGLGICLRLDDWFADEKTDRFRCFMSVHLKILHPIFDENKRVLYLSNRNDTIREFKSNSGIFWKVLPGKSLDYVLNPINNKWLSADGNLTIKAQMKHKLNKK